MSDLLHTLPRRLLASLARHFRSALKDGSGALMVEMVISVTILVAISSATLVGVNAAQRARHRLDLHAEAENIARNQMEYVFSLPYETSTGLYALASGLPSGYTISVTSTVESTEDTNLQRIRVRIIRDGEEILSLDTKRVKD